MMSFFGELRIITDHYRHKLLKRTRVMTIHTEVLYDDRVWEKVKKYVLSGKKAIWFVLTPVNLDFLLGNNGYQGSGKEYEKKVLPRYKWLQEHGQDVQLHVHLRTIPQLYETTEEARRDTEHKVKNGAEWLRKNGFNVDKIVFGWWSYNSISAEIAEKYGLKVVKRTDYYFLHDYDFLHSIGKGKIYD